MNADRLKLIKFLFFAMVFVDIFWDMLTLVLPIGILSFLSSTVTNTGEAILFMVVLDDYYNHALSDVVKFALVAIIAVIAVLFLVTGGLLI